MSWSSRGVGHPLWIAALLVLVVNDHFLKRAGLVPGWLTGKLSDFAGLIVAPVLLATIAGARRGRWRVVACALVGLGFAGVKLSPHVARAVERALALAHVHWRLWSDATDLWALAILPLAWWLAGAPGSTAAPARSAAIERPRPPTPRRTSERAWVIVGALACLATSKAPPFVTLDLSLMNRTRAAAPMAIYRAAPPIDCAALGAGDHTPLDTASFAVDGCVRLEPGKSTPLGQIVVAKQDPADAGSAPACTVLVLRAVGLADTVLTWPATAIESTDETANELYLEEAGSGLDVAGTDYVQVWPATFTLPASGCDGAP